MCTSTSSCAPPLVLVPYGTSKDETPIVDAPEPKENPPIESHNGKLTKVMSEHL